MLVVWARPARSDIRRTRPDAATIYPRRIPATPDPGNTVVVAVPMPLECRRRWNGIRVAERSGPLPAVSFSLSDV
ncbi:hypothetical protein BL254_02935 [Protofrankia sp. BMG5.30]|nr:hypothetical protein BL254_02935 [Protofrankia sp. BMG5.30]